MIMIWSSATPSSSKCWRKSFFSRKDLPERRSPVTIFISPFPFERTNWSMYLLLFTIIFFQKMSLVTKFGSKDSAFYLNNEYNVLFFIRLRLLWGSQLQFSFSSAIEENFIAFGCTVFGGKRNTDRTDNTLKETAPSSTRHTYILCGLKARLWPHY